VPALKVDSETARFLDLTTPQPHMLWRWIKMSSDASEEERKRRATLWEVTQPSSCNGGSVGFYVTLLSAHTPKISESA
jgi:hypothetical protein